MKRPQQKRAPVDLYNTSYENFAARVQAAVRVATYGEDLGQSSWMTAAELRRFIQLLKLSSSSHVLEVGCGSGGTALYVARKVGCHITGLDINEHGIKNANSLARQQGLDALVQFQMADATRRSPFAEKTFDAVFCNDAMCHLAQRNDILRDWFRVLKPGGRMLFTDAMIITGTVSNEELATRSSIGTYFFLPPGENEKLIQASGFQLIGAADLTAAVAKVARRWHDSRKRRQKDLVRIEGQTNFDGLQRFLWCVHTVSAERRVSRFMYLARKSTVRR